jgi:perosamine synthetase
VTVAMAPEPGFLVPMSAPDITEDDVAAVAAVVRSGRLALGPKCLEFEESLAQYVGVRHAVAVSSGTAALHLLVRGLGIGEGDEVLVPSFTFAASVNAILYERATPVFVDIEPDTYNLDPADLEGKITSRTRAVMAVDVFGHPAPWRELSEIRSRHGLAVIDDACEGLGAEYQGRKLGAFGSGAAFAFYPNKQITAGEGGVIVTDDDDLAEYARSARNQGRGDGPWLEHARLGYNYRLDDMSAALVGSQLGRIEEVLRKRAHVAAMYAERLAGVAGVRLPHVDPSVRMSWFVYVVTLARGIDAARVIAGMEKRRIPVRVYFVPIHTQPYIRDLGIPECTLPVTDSLAGRTLALPFHGNLLAGEADLVVSALKASIHEASQ